MQKLPILHFRKGCNSALTWPTLEQRARSLLGCLSFGGSGYASGRTDRTPARYERWHKPDACRAGHVPELSGRYAPHFREKFGRQERPERSALSLPEVRDGN